MVGAVGEGRIRCTPWHDEGVGRAWGGDGEGMERAWGVRQGKGVGRAWGGHGEVVWGARLQLL